MQTYPMNHAQKVQNDDLLMKRAVGVGRIISHPFVFLTFESVGTTSHDKGLVSRTREINIGGLKMPTLLII